MADKSFHDDPRVITKINFTPWKNLDKGVVHDTKFYKLGGWADYVGRKSAIISEPEDIDLIEQWKASELDLQAFMRTQTQEMSKRNTKDFNRLFEPGKFSKEEVKEEMRKIDNEQIVYEMFVNLGQLGIDTKFITTDKWKKVLEPSLKGLLKGSSIDWQNITGYWVLHGNTSWPHAHIAFWEKEKVYENGKSWRKRGFIDKASNNKFKRVLYQRIAQSQEYENINASKNEIWKQRNNLREELKNIVNTLNSDEKNKVLGDIAIIRNELKGIRNVSYAKQNETVKKAVWEIFEAVKEDNPYFEKIYYEYTTKLDILNNLKSNNTFTNRQVMEAINKEKDNFEKFVGNIIIKSAISGDSGRFLDNIKSYKKEDWKDIEEDKKKQKRKKIIDKLFNEIIFDINRREKSKINKATWKARRGY
ncbi:hypothetical protein ACWXVT_02255 [Mycoplasma sp. 1573]